MRWSDFREGSTFAAAFCYSVAIFIGLLGLRGFHVLLLLVLRPPKPYRTNTDHVRISSGFASIIDPLIMQTTPLSPSSSTTSHHEPTCMHDPFVLSLLGAGLRCEVASSDHPGVRVPIPESAGRASSLQDPGRGLARV